MKTKNPVVSLITWLAIAGGMVAFLNGCDVSYAQTVTQQFGSNTITLQVPTNLPPATAQGFADTILSYFSSYSALQTFQTNDMVDVWTGAEYVNGANTAVELGVSFNTPLTLGPVRVGIESVTRNAPGIAQAIYTQEAGINGQYVVHDVKVVGFLDGGYDTQAKGGTVSFGARILKALTENTYAGLSISERETAGKFSAYPTVGVLAGAKF